MRLKDETLKKLRPLIKSNQIEFYQEGSKNRVKFSLSDKQAINLIKAQYDKVEEGDGANEQIRQIIRDLTEDLAEQQAIAKANVAEANAKDIEFNTNEEASDESEDKEAGE